MNEFIKILLSLSVSGALLLLLIWGLKPLYRNKFSKRWQYYIWIIVALRFMLPFTPDTTIVGSLFEKFDTAAITNEIPTSPNAPGSVNPGNSGTEALQTNRDITAAAMHEPFNKYVCLFFIWSALALVLFVRRVTVYQGFIQYIKAGNQEVSDIKILNLLSDCEEKLNIKTRVELSSNPLIASPMLIGFFRPRIVLPNRNLEDKELSYIFVHELIHYEQRDMFYKWLIQIVVCAHWFNPFVYLLESEVNKSCELSCDENIISLLDENAKRAYGETLISFLKASNLYKSSLASITLTEGAEQLKERLGAIMCFKKKSKTIKAITMIFTAAICIGYIAAGAYAAPIKEERFEREEDAGKNEQIIENNVVGNDASHKYTYTQRGFYCNSYIIEMGWNFYAISPEYYSATEIALADKTNLTVYFSDAAKDYMHDSEAVSALEELIYSLKSTNISPAIEMPLILSVTPVVADDIPAFAEEYFQNEDLIKFPALFSVLDETSRRDYWQKAYDADKIALFSTIVRYMDENLVLQYVDKTEQDSKTNFFAVLSDYMQPSDLKRYAKKYYDAGNIARFTILLDCMTKEDRQEWLIKSQADKKTNFVAVLSDELLD